MIAFIKHVLPRFLRPAILAQELNCGLKSRVFLERLFANDGFADRSTNESRISNITFQKASANKQHLNFLSNSFVLSSTIITISIERLRSIPSCTIPNDIFFFNCDNVKPACIKFSGMFIILISPLVVSLFAAIDDSENCSTKHIDCIC
ncbi:hypothetical protein DERP_011445 [Dermatophagoides pteronyssinus]|uniref:Uncharacterized protein n=1 Tax=Dermatophagoides pteronyssinus TaxID=6956 RepID=A0ABQ8J586_DERPT|nr:hypothetical protein DERP_011445 [Dermatophagoides pteronyssinus]